ncbi:hypothetical protein [Synechococcus sp. PCC 6312]|uniref:hypothetical protein n=1 Tax=Synechococcus sp. (strain ATCC 27167 / PCC 6312) TaxID=195253 RepID=UPI00029F2701|nr:hypothetical protein [Synechococcus sp. PCC 6312]AFY61847.1 hypothetical protein Syn6312_2767 [Synechococcus sp. PCC 6312]
MDEFSRLFSEVVMSRVLERLDGSTAYLLRGCRVSKSGSSLVVGCPSDQVAIKLSTCLNQSLGQRCQSLGFVQVFFVCPDAFAFQFDLNEFGFVLNI